MKELLNPYIAGAPVVEPSMFFGRQDVFDWIEQSLTGRYVNHILVIHGQRRVGKTSVLKQIPNHLPSQFIHVFFDLQGRTHTTLDRFQWWVAREISRAVNQAQGGSIPVPEHSLFLQDGEYLAATFLPEVLTKLGEANLLLTFDEFDTLSEPEIQQSLTKPLITYLRRLFDTPKLNFIFSIGSSGHKLENMQASYTEFFKSALYRKISFLKQEDCARLIAQPVEGVLSYTPDAVERIYAITSGHPYFTQLICHELFALSQKTGRTTLVREDVEAILEDVIERGTVNLKFVWDEANDLEKWILSSLAHELQGQEEEMHSLGIKKQAQCTDKQLATALQNQHVRCSENDLNSALVHLREKDVITQENHFIVELLCIWLLKNRPLDRVREELVQVNPIANRYNEIGDEFRELGQREKALESYQQALATDPTNLRAQVSIANLYLEGKEFEQAAHGFEAALRIDDDDIVARGGFCSALMQLGTAAETEGKPEEAIGYFQRLLAINPEYAEARMRSGAIYAQQAEQALAAGEAEQALNYFSKAVEQCPEDSQLAARFAQAREEHTRRLILELLQESKQAEEKRDWQAALAAIQRALQLAPTEPTLLKHFALVKDAPRREQIANLRAHAQEMERDERWNEAVKDWENCLALKPDDLDYINQSLERSRQGQKLAADYNLAQGAIRDGRYNQAIALLQGIIAINPAYKDAAKLLVDCLNIRPKKQLKLPKIPRRWLGWAGLALVLVLIIGGIASQWSAISPLLAGIWKPNTDVSTQATTQLPSAVQVAGIAPPTMTASTPPPTDAEGSQEMKSIDWWIDKLTEGRPPDVEDDFSSPTLDAYWEVDKGAQNSTLLDGALRLNNEYLIGDESLKAVNYIHQVDLRFGGITEDEVFAFGIRLTPTIEGKGTEYVLFMYPYTGKWMVQTTTDPFGTQYAGVMNGDLGPIEANRWYEFGVVVNEQEIQLFWEGEIFFSQSEITLYGPYNHYGLDLKSSGEATLDIDNWQFWDLGLPSYMKNDWITAHEPTVAEENFTPGEGWIFDPTENESYEDGGADLFTQGGQTYLSSDDLSGKNIAMEVSFKSRDIPESTALFWILGQNTATGESIIFEYLPANGIWNIFDGNNNIREKLVIGLAPPTPIGSVATFTVVVNGTRVSVFYEDTFLTSVILEQGSPGTENMLAIKSDENTYARVWISEIRFWNLDAVEWQSSDWVDARPETVLLDNFTGGEGMVFHPEENEKYVDGEIVLYTNDGETSLTHADMQGGNIALEVSFVPNYMADTSSLVLNLGKDTTTLDCLEFSYFPNTGAWEINKVVNRNWELLASGTAQPTPVQTSATILVVVDNDQVRAYLNNNYIGKAEIGLPPPGLMNEIVVRDRENKYTRVDIIKIRFWDLANGEGDVTGGSESGEVSNTITQAINDITGGRPPDYEDDFSSDTLNEYWTFDSGAQAATLQDGVLRLDNDIMIGGDPLNALNYILQVNLRFSEISEDRIFNFITRHTSLTEGWTEYSLAINPFSGLLQMHVLKEPVGESIVLQEGQIEPIEPGGWSDLGIVVNHEVIQVYWNDKLVLTQEDIILFGTENYFGLGALPGEEPGKETLDIDNWRFWDLGTPIWMRNDWITGSLPTYADDNFTPYEGWQFSQEIEKYEDGNFVLYTPGDERYLTRDDFHIENFALEASFSPRDMPDYAMIGFLVRKTEPNDRLMFFYYPSTGFWQIYLNESKGGQFTQRELSSGWTQPTPQDSIATISVLMDGERLSAFLGDTFLGYVESTLSSEGARNELAIQGNSVGYAEADISSIRFWDLDPLKWTNYEFLTSEQPVFTDDNFIEGEGWTFEPVENGKFEEGKAVLFTEGGQYIPITTLTRTELQGTHIALEVTFIPRKMSDTASLVWSLMLNTNGVCELSLTLEPATGQWNIGQIEHGAAQGLAQGIIQPVPENSTGMIMVATDGKHISAFYNGALIGSAITTNSCLYLENSIALQNVEEIFTQADIVKISMWSPDG